MSKRVKILLEAVAAVIGISGFAVAAFCQYYGDSAQPYYSPGTWTTSGTSVLLAESTYTLGSTTNPITTAYVGDLHATTITVSGVSAGDLLPDADVTRRLGNSSFRWKGLSVLSASTTRLELAGGTTGTIDSIGRTCFYVTSPTGSKWAITFPNGVETPVWNGNCN
jgi:hypothetical protein